MFELFIGISSIGTLSPLFEFTSHMSLDPSLSSSSSLECIISNKSGEVALIVSIIDADNGLT
jgi:hypothetical protein